MKINKDQNKSFNAKNHKEMTNSFENKGESFEAIKIYKELISKEKSNFKLYLKLSENYINIGDTKNSIDCLKKAIKLKPDFAQAHFKLGYLYQIKNEINSAIISYKRAIESNSNFSEAYNNLGIALKDIGKYFEAINCFREVIRLNPNFPAAYNNIGLIFHENGKFNYAIASYKKAIQLNNNFADAYFNLGNTYLKEDKLCESIECYEKSINLNPRSINSYINISFSQKELGNFSESINSLKKALNLEPNNLLALNNLSILYLLLGDYKSGWNNYNIYGVQSEKEKYFLSHKQLIIPSWNGESLESRDKLLVICEHGLGDTLQFMRYIKYLTKKKIDVSFCPQENLRDLVKVSNIHNNPISNEEAKSISDGRWTSILALPKFLKVSDSEPLINSSYLRTKNSLVDKWKSILSIEKKPIVGINWQGNKEYGSQIGRSFPLDLFSIISKRNEVTFLSLQKGYGSEQLRSCTFMDKFVGCQNQIDHVWDFLEIAAIIKNCHLIITSDTSVAHLSGGLGKETWLLLKYVPEWRWGLKDNKSSWYNSMRIFRQKKRGDWLEVMERVSLELENKINYFE